MVDAATRRLVRRRAGDRCEYCRLLQKLTEVPLHIEPIVARQHGGGDGKSNLALACDRCNLNKGPNLSSIDPETGNQEARFHPRREAWEAHFAFQGRQLPGSRRPAGPPCSSSR